MSLYELINEFEANNHADTISSFDKNVIENMNKSRFEEQIILVERLVAAAKAVGHPYNHPLKKIGCCEYSQNMRISIPQINEAYRNALNSLNETKMKKGLFLSKRGNNDICSLL